MTITQFRGEWLALSNYAPIPAYWDGVKYPTSEHAFAAAKTLSVAERADIRVAASPGEAKRIGRRVALRPDWDRYRLTAMRRILVTKFAPGTAALETLLSTGRWVRLVEGNTWHDQFWGDCSCPKHEGVIGENQLGKALMVLRDYYLV